jgi:hypothetical protein
VVVPVAGINRAVVQAINVGRSIADDVLAVLGGDDPREAADVRARWEVQLPEVPLVTVGRCRALVSPVLATDVLDDMLPQDASGRTFVIIPEFVARRWWEQILYNQSATGCDRHAGSAAHGRGQRSVPAREWRPGGTASSHRPSRREPTTARFVDGLKTVRSRPGGQRRCGAIISDVHRTIGA